MTFTEHQKVLLTATILANKKSQGANATIREPNVRSRLLEDQSNDEPEEDPRSLASETFAEEARRSVLRGGQMDPGS